MNRLDEEFLILILLPNFVEIFNNVIIKFRVKYVFNPRLVYTSVFFVWRNLQKWTKPKSITFLNKIKFLNYIYFQKVYSLFHFKKVPVFFTKICTLYAFIVFIWTLDNVEMVRTRHNFTKCLLTMDISFDKTWGPFVFIN